MIIHVTQKHIDNGIPLDCTDCPVALALNEATGTEWIVSGRFMSYKKRSFLAYLTTGLKEHLTTGLKT